MKYVVYEMNGMNANQQNTSQTGPCQPGTGPDRLFSIVYSHSNGFKKTNSIIRAVCACLTQLAHIQAQPLVNTQKHTPCTSLQLFNHCHQCLSLSTPFIAVKGLFQKGSFQVLSHSFKCKWTSKSPQKLNLHLFPSSEGFSLPSTI